MSAGQWIQLFVHPEDAEIQRLAELTGRPPEVCLAAVLRWFWHVDGKCESAEAGINDDGFHRITRWRSMRGKLSLAEAMRDKHVGWLITASDGTLLVPKFEQHFGRSAKRRALESRRKMSARQADKTAQNVRTPSGQNADKTRTFCAPTRQDSTDTRDRQYTNRSGPERSKTKNRSGKGESEGETGPDRDLDLDCAGPGRKSGNPKSARTQSKPRGANGGPGIPSVPVESLGAPLEREIGPTEYERWTQFFVLHLCIAFGLNGDRAIAQRRAFRRVAADVLRTQDPDALGRRLVDLAKEKQTAEPRLDRPIAAWQAAAKRILAGEIDEESKTT